MSEKLGEVIGAKKTKWNPTENRFVCFLDIMGFKDMVMRSTHNHIYNLLVELSKYRASLENAEGLPEKYDSDSLKTVSFSDSIVIFSKNDSVECFEIMTNAVSWLFAKALEQGIPMKGAIALGEMSVNIKRQIFFGQPLIDAYLLEEDVAYYGVVIHNTTEKFLNNEKVPDSSKDLYINCITPLKSGNIEHINLNWTDWVSDKKNKDKKVENIKLMKKQRERTSGKPRKYIDNTIKVINEIYK